MAKKNTSIGTVLLEMGSILIAVFLAFTLENWRDEQKNTELAEQVFQDVLVELEENHAMILRKDSAFSVFLNALHKTVQFPNDTSIDLDYSIHNFDFSAWETAQLSQAVLHMEYTKVKNIKKCYFMLSFARKLSQNIMDIITSPDFADHSRSLAARKSIRVNAISLSQTNAVLVELLDNMVKRYRADEN